MKGYGCTVDFDGERLTISGADNASNVVLLGDDWERGSVSLTREEIRSVTCKKGLVTNGTLTVYAKDGKKYVARYFNKANAEFQALAAQLT